MAESASVLATSALSVQNQDLSTPSNNTITGTAIATKAWPVFDANGEYVKEDGATVYITETGVQIRVISPDGKAPTTAPIVEIHDNGGPTSWDNGKTKFLISAYKELKEQGGRDGGFPTKKAMWQKISEQLNKEFGGAFSGAQVENKWKTLKRGYRRTKGRMGASGRIHFEREDYRALCDILEKERHMMIESRHMQENFESSDSCDEDRSDGNSGSLSFKRRSTGSSLHKIHLTKRLKDAAPESSGEILKKLDSFERARQRRHDERMGLLKRLVTAMESVANSIEKSTNSHGND